MRTIKELSDLEQKRLGQGVVVIGKDLFSRVFDLAKEIDVSREAVINDLLDLMEAVFSAPVPLDKLEIADILVVNSTENEFDLYRAAERLDVDPDELQTILRGDK